MFSFFSRMNQTRVSLGVPLLEITATAIECIPSLTDTLELAPGGVILCSATLVLTQDDVDGGSLTSAVFGLGEASDGQAVLAEDSVAVEFGQSVGLSVGGLCAWTER